MNSNSQERDAQSSAPNNTNPQRNPNPNPNPNFKPRNYGTGSGSNPAQAGKTGNNPNRSNNRNNKNRGNFRRTNENPIKTNSVAYDKAHYVVKRHNMSTEESVASAIQGIKPIRNTRGTGMNRGNLAKSFINPMLEVGQQIDSNSPDQFDNGPAVRIIPLGGTNEVGMNMTAFECGDDIIVFDTGFGFGGGEKFPGVDYTIPDTSYLEQNRHKIKGIIYTHGHLDHIGAAPFVLPKLGNVPIFAMPLTLALLKNRLHEFNLSDKIMAKIIDPTQPLKLGVFELEFFRLNHSIPDVVGLGINTPMGRIVYATDWKFDMTPYDGKLSEYNKIAELGEKGVRLLMTDSLGILNPGKTISEQDIKREILSVFKKAQGRVILTTFSTTIARLQHTVDCCEATGRKLALLGRSMVNNFNVCFELGYIRVPAGLIVDMRELDKLPPEKACILSTGSQGEDNAALNRMARDEHDQIKLQGGDSVIFSTKPIPGNEDAVAELMAKLSRKGVEVYMHKQFKLHVSGHACHEDLKLLIALTRPKYLMPIHGDHFMLRKVAELGVTMGIPWQNNILVENARITEMRPTDIVETEEIVGDKYLLVDGSGIGAVSEVVLQERRQLSQQGTVILVLLVNKQRKLIGGPEIISRGFVYMKSSGDLFEEIKNEIQSKFDTIKAEPGSKTYWSDLRNGLRNLARDFIVSKTEKEPVVIPVVVQV